MQDFDVYVWIDGRAAPFDCVLRSYDYSSKQEQATGGEGGGSGGSSTWVLRRVAPVLQALNVSTWLCGMRECMRTVLVLKGGGRCMPCVCMCDWRNRPGVYVFVSTSA